MAIVSENSIKEFQKKVIVKGSEKTDDKMFYVFGTGFDVSYISCWLIARRPFFVLFALLPHKCFIFPLLHLLVPSEHRALPFRTPYKLNRKLNRQKRRSTIVEVFISTIIEVRKIIKIYGRRTVNFMKIECDIFYRRSSTNLLRILGDICIADSSSTKRWRRVDDLLIGKRSVASSLKFVDFQTKPTNNDNYFRMSWATIFTFFCHEFHVKLVWLGVKLVKPAIMLLTLLIFR